MRRMPDLPRLPDGAAGGRPLPDIAGLTADSRAVRPGFLFAALPGARQDGRDFIAEAVARGAAMVLAPRGTEWPPGVPPRPLLTDANPRALLARMAAAFHGAQPATLVAVTGTNGKTSTVDFLRQIWAMDRPAASLGTLGVIAPGFSPGPSLTTPDPVALHEKLAQLAASGIGHAAMEASSHGLDQHRLDGVRLSAAAFTNLTRDHLDYHGTMAAYRAAKLRLFGLLPAGAPAVAHADMEAETLDAIREAAAQLRLLTVGERGDAVGIAAVQPSPSGQTLRIRAFGAAMEIALPLVGRFQADNALLAAALAHVTGTTDAFARLARLQGVRGRLERVAVLPSGAAVYVDYAHTPDAVGRAIAALRPHTSGRLHIVLGAGGDRDPGKRPLMGHAACAADRVIVTDDNPRSEDPAVIRTAVREGCPRAIEIGDRRAAIGAAMSDLEPGDVLVIAGKGHESGQEIAGVVHPFDDAGVVRAFAEGA
jgi:UDP-N-acetylmuramoyl-L-alanyl-D-glutamate--2,6-diaminopimelate ligase